MITPREFKSRMGFILLGFFTFYLVEPLRTYIDAHANISPFIIGIGGILATLYLFEF